MIVIRPTEMEDAAQLAACITQVAHERRFLANTQGFSIEKTRNYIELLRGGGGVHIVALEDENVVGWCDIAPGTFEGLAHAGHLGMGLLPNYRNRGWGKKLLFSALQTAFSMGFERIDLEVFSSNKAAVTLYRHAGFREEGCKRKGRKLEGQCDDILLFGLLREEWHG